MLNAKMPVSKNATELGRHRSTVYRDIQRNGFVDEELPQLNGYYGVTAQNLALRRRARRGKLEVALLIRPVCSLLKVDQGFI